MKLCENCQNTIEAKIGSGRFCSLKCSRSFSTKIKRKEINEKVKEKFKTKNLVTKVCVICGNDFISKFAKRNNRKTCGKECSKKLESSSSIRLSDESRRKISEARIKSIENGNVGYGIKCFYDDIRCDSALEYTFIKWYLSNNPSSKIKRFNGSITKLGITYIPDFIIDDKILVEVKYQNTFIGNALSEKWKTYIETQEKKKEILENSGYDYIWFTDATCGQRFYRKCLREVKKNSIDNINFDDKKLKTTEKKKSGGQNRLTEEKLAEWKNAINSVDLSKFGSIAKIAKLMNCSSSNAKRIIKKYF